MPDNYEHYISKNIQAFYRRRLFSPMIYLVLLAVLWIVFPLGAMHSFPTIPKLRTPTRTITVMYA